MESLNHAIATSSPQPVLPWSIPAAMGLNVKPILDLKALPFALVVKVTNSDKASFNVLLQLQIPPATVTSESLPKWVLPNKYRMYC